MGRLLSADRFAMRRLFLRLLASLSFELSSQDTEMRIYKTKADNVYNKALFVDGKKVGGVQQVNVDFNIKKGLTFVTLRMAIKRNSFKVKRGGKGQQHITFKTVNEAFR